MEFSSKFQIMTVHLLFLAATVAGFLYGQRSPAQLKVSGYGIAQKGSLRSQSKSNRKPASQAQATAPLSSDSSSEGQARGQVQAWDQVQLPAEAQRQMFQPELLPVQFDMGPGDLVSNEFGFGVLDFLAGFSATRIASTDKSTGGTASLLTTDNIQVGLRYRQLITPNFHTIFSFQDRKLDFVAPVIGSLTSTSIQLFSFSAGAEYEFAKKFTGSLTVGSEQLPFLKGVSLTQSSIDQLSVPDASLYISYDFLDRHPFRVGAEGFLKEFLPTNSDTYQSSANTGFGGRLYVRQGVNSHFRFELGIGATVINENTSIVNQQQVDYGLDLKLSLPVGGSF